MTPPGTAGWSQPRQATVATMVARRLARRWLRFMVDLERIRIHPEYFDERHPNYETAADL